MKLGERIGVPPIFAHGVHGRAASVGAHVLHVPIVELTNRNVAVSFALLSLSPHYMNV